MHHQFYSVRASRILHYSYNVSPYSTVRAFSLVEVVLALGVISFACLTLMGLLTMGLTTIRQSIGTTVQAQIMQSLVNDAQVQSYNQGNFTNSAGASPATYYFDDEGTLLKNNTGWLYEARVTSSSMTLPGAPAAVNQQSTAAVLQAVITARNNPNTSTTNILVWPNTGT